MSEPQFRRMRPQKRQPAGHWRNSTQYKALRSQFFKSHGVIGVCSVCRGPVDMRLSGKLGWGPTVDHVVPVAGGAVPLDVTNWRLAHRKCNAEKGTWVPVARRTSTPTPSGVQVSGFAWSRPGCTCRQEPDRFSMCRTCEEYIHGGTRR